jgi:glutamate-1-semialdehyde aminotransferase
LPLSFSMKMATIFSFKSERVDFQPKEFLQEFRGETEQSGSMLMLDEVIIRFTSAFSQEHFGIPADLGMYGNL